MRTFFIVIMALSLSWRAAAQTLTNTITPYIEVVGYVEEEVLPDIAHLSIIIDESDPLTASKGVEEMEKRLINTVKSLGIDVEKLTIQNITSNFTKRRNINIRNSYSLEVGNLEVLAELIDQLKNEGISNVRIVSYEISDKDERLLAMKGAAIKNAKLKAEAIASGTDQKVGDLLQAFDQENIYSYRTNVMANSVMSRSSDSLEQDTTPALEIEKIKISSAIRTLWILH